MSADSPHLLVSIGVACVDYIASVANFPQPDSKIRTQGLTIAGGGNAANTACATARLGLPSRLITRVGADGIGEQILGEIAAQGVDITTTRALSVGQSPFSYIILDETTKTRTIIHTPGEELHPADIDVDIILHGATLVHTDGRHTTAAETLLRAATERRLPILVDIERIIAQPLLAYATYAVVQRAIALELTGKEDIGAALACLLQERAHKATWIVCSLGADGALALSRDASDVVSTPALAPGETISTWLETERALSNGDGVDPFARHATRAISARTLSYGGQQYTAHYCPAIIVSPTQVVDPTGAGDRFTAGLLLGIARGASLQAALRLGTNLGARKVMEKGARAGVPDRDDPIIAQILAENK